MNKKELETKYPKGTKLYIHKIEGETIPKGSIGTVHHIDDALQLHCHIQLPDGASLTLGISEIYGDRFDIMTTN